MFFFSLTVFLVGFVDNFCSPRDSSQRYVTPHYSWSLLRDMFRGRGDIRRGWRTDDEYSGTKIPQSREWAVNPREKCL